MTQADTSKKHELGNTISRSWFFTWNNYNDLDIKFLLTQLHSAFSYIFQEEISSTGTEHLQGVIRWKNAIRFSTLKKWNKSIHWERCRSFKHAVNYCNKEETRNGKIFSKNVAQYLTDTKSSRLKQTEFLAFLKIQKLKMLKSLIDEFTVEEIASVLH